VKKIVIIDNCWECPHHEYMLSRQWCSKSRRYLPKDFTEDMMPEWCKLPNAANQQEGGE